MLISGRQVNHVSSAKGNRQTRVYRLHLRPFIVAWLPNHGHETWTLVQNPNPASVTVRVSYLPQGGDTPVSFTDEIPPNTRSTYNMGDKIPSGRASIMVESLDGARPVMAEHSVYWNDRGAGTNTVGAYSD